METITASVPVTGDGWRELRERRDLTVTDLALLTGLTRGTIEKLELGGSVNRATRNLVLVALRDPDALKAAIA
jgi:transcriptional regulator with XRE-family HTH domain